MSNITEWFDLAEFDAFIGTLNFFTDYTITTGDDEFVLLVRLSNEAPAKNLKLFISDLIAIQEFCSPADSADFFQNGKYIEFIFENRALKGYAAAQA